MNRRTFLGTCLATAGGACMPLPALPLPRSTPRARSNYVDEIDPNYHGVRERIIELVKAGHKVDRWELRALRDGFRLMRVFMKDGPPLTWNQPWEGESI
jgi:hypothetical protein